MGVTGEDARFALSHHRLHQRHLVLELAAPPRENDLPVDVGRMLDTLPTSAAKRLACPTTRLVVCSKLR